MPSLSWIAPGLSGQIGSMPKGLQCQQGKRSQIKEWITWRNYELTCLRPLFRDGFSYSILFLMWRVTLPLLLPCLSLLGPICNHTPDMSTNSGSDPFCSSSFTFLIWDAQSACSALHGRYTYRQECDKP